MLNEDYKLFESIEALVEQLRKPFLNIKTCEKFYLDGNKGQMITACLDVIGDTCEALRDYIKYPFPEELGIKYLYLYGVLQALFIQSDAVQHLYEGFNKTYAMPNELKRIRNVRNYSTGHPTKKNTHNKAIFYFNFISRMTIEKTGFTLQKESSEGESGFEEVDINNLIESQLSEISKALNDLIRKLQIQSD